MKFERSDDSADEVLRVVKADALLVAVCLWWRPSRWQKGRRTRRGPGTCLSRVLRAWCIRQWKRIKTLKLSSLSPIFPQRHIVKKPRDRDRSHA